MASSPCKDSGPAVCVYRFSAYPSLAITDVLVGFLQANSPLVDCDVILTAVPGTNGVLSRVTPFLLYAGPSGKSVCGGGGSAAKQQCGISSTISSSAASKEQLFSLCHGIPLSDWAAARCLVNHLASAGASVDFLLDVHVEPRVLEDTLTPQKKENSPVFLRYTAASAVDVCEAWWSRAEAQAIKGGHDEGVDEAEEGYAAYFATLLGSPATAEGDHLPFLFDTRFPTLADMGLHVLLRRFPRASALLQKTLLLRMAAAASSSSAGGGASSPEAAAAAGLISAWMERVAVLTAAPAGSGGGQAAAAGTCLAASGEVVEKCCQQSNKRGGGARGSAVLAPAGATQNATKDARAGAAAGTATPRTAADGPDATGAVNFLKQIVESDLRTGKHKTVITRFPPEPNGFLHLGHAKSICVNFGLATAFNGRCHLRFDDTNPMKEEMRYIESIQRDVKWMGGDWGGHLYYASDYFEQLYEWAEVLIKKGLAFVDDDDQEAIRRKRGSITQPGENSGFRNRSVEENLDLFRRMRAGEFEEGSRVLRAKINMAHSNMNMRDPIMYRILKKHHPRTGDKWVIYPTYDYAHGQSDSLEGITHSICTLEFELHRPLYDWFQEMLNIPRTRQIEFARLNVTNTVMSKRKLLALVVEKWVDGWDDPRLPTLAGLRRRGVPAAALRTFCDRVGVARRESVIQLELLERCIREALHPIAPRRFAIQQPLRVFIPNFEGKEEVVTAPNHPENHSFGTRELHFTSNIFIDREDFMENPAPGYHRLTLGGEVRLKHAYWIKCEEVVKDADGHVLELRCTYDPQTKMAAVAPDGRKVKGTIQWLSNKDAAPAELRVYGRLFNKANPEEVEEGTPDASWRDHINPDSLKVYRGLVERCVTDRKVFPPQSSVQFERLGFFTPDASTLPEVDALGEDAEEEAAVGRSAGGGGVRAGAGDLPVFNLTVSLQEGFTTNEDAEKEKARAQDKLAREKAALERQKKKEEREMKKLIKEKQSQQHAPTAPVCANYSAARSSETKTRKAVFWGEGEAGAGAAPTSGDRPGHRGVG